MTLEKTLRAIVVAGIFALPFIVFIVSTSLYFPFITGKNFTFRIIVEIIAGAWLALAIMNPEYRPRRSWLLGAFAIFVGIIALADALGVYPFKSFWSNYERMDGLVTLVHLLLYFIVATTVLSKEKLWQRLFQTSLVASFFVGCHALLQLFGVVSLNPGFSSTARLDATFGNPIYLAAYMLFHAFIAALLLAQYARENGGLRNKSIVYAYGGAVAFCTLILFLTGTRGTMLGLAGGVLLAAFLFILKGREVLPRVRSIAIAVIAIVLLFAGTIYVVRDQAWVREAPILSRLATISITERTAQARIMNWGTAWQGVKERPLLGWGQENFAVVFNKYYNPKMYAEEQWFDRVHNVIFDWLIAGGFLGLFAYLSLFAISLYYLWRTKNGASSFTIFEQSILTGLLAAYFFHNLFVFDNIVSYILFVTILGYIAHRAEAVSEARRLFSNIVTPRNAAPIIVVGAIFVTWAGAWFVNANALAANKLLLKAMAPHQEGITKNLQYFEEAIARNSFGTQEAREQLVQVTNQIGRSEQVPVEVKQQFLQKAAEEMMAQAERSPLDPRFPLFLGSLLNSFGLFNEATEALSRARELAPRKQTILFEYASNAFGRGDTKTALAVFKEAFELAPEYRDARILYASVAIRSNNLALADEILAPVVESGEAADPRIAAAYIAIKRVDKIVPLWEARVKAMPDDVEARFLLASAYGELGNIAKAREQLDAAVAINPAVREQAEQLLKEIRGAR